MAKKHRYIKKIRRYLLRYKFIKETPYADGSFINLSFQSINFDARHVWIGNYGKKSFSVDLEDWDDETRFDNTVASYECNDVKKTCRIIIDWLNGVPLVDMSFTGAKLVYLQQKTSCDS